MKKVPKIQIRLTLEFALFFLILSISVYFYFSKRFEDQMDEKYKYKASVFINFIKNNPQIFEDKKISDPEVMKKVIDLNDAVYLVLEDLNNNVFDAINFEEAEKNLYVLGGDGQTGISPDEKVFRVSLPIILKSKQEGRVYVGFRSLEDGQKIIKNRLLTALFSLVIFLGGIVFTYFLSSISFKPLAKIIKKLDSVVHEAEPPKGSDQIKVLEDKVDIVLHELETSSQKVESLNKKLHENFKDKIAELNFEINQRKRAEASLQKSEEQFRLVFQNAPIAIILISPVGKILSVNNSFCDTLGYTKEEIIGVPINYLFEKGEFEAAFNDNFDFNGKPIYDIHTEKKIYKKEGVQINAIVKSVAILDEEQKVKHYVMQILDISKIRKVQDDLVEALKKAEESDRLKSAFLAQMSHEIRTPLNVILTSVPLLADEIGNNDEEIKIILDSVRSAGKRLQRTIDMILNMSAIQSGNYKVQYEKFDLIEDIKKLVNEFKPLCEEKGLELRFLKNTNQCFITADRYTVQQIFQNLINNAYKYTNKGFVEVSVKNTIDSRIKVEVSDSGIGMSKDYMDKIFHPFSQEDAGQKREYEGNGLGLALVKNYIDLNKATIQVQSEKNKGSVFTVVFPKDQKTESSEKSTEDLSNQLSI